MADTHITYMGGDGGQSAVPLKAIDNGDGTYTLASGGSAGGVIPAGENHIGSVTGLTSFVTSTLVISNAGEHVAGDYVGTSTTPQAFTNAVRTSGNKGIVTSLIASDKAAAAAVDMELWLFSATFTAPAGNAAWSITDAHQLLCLGVIEMPSENWYLNAGGKVFTKGAIGLVIQPAATSLFYALVSRGTFTWADGDLTLTLGITLD